jgi:endonuclease G, mitochondrial
MSTYILLLLLLSIAGVVVYTYSNKKNESTSNEGSPIVPKTKQAESKVNSPSKPSKPLEEHKKTESTPKAEEPVIPKTKQNETKVDTPKIPTIPIDNSNKSKMENPSEITPVEKPKTKKTTDEKAALYTDRKGYDIDFIKTDKFKIDLDDLLKNLKPLLSEIKNPTSKNKHFLNYHHFTVVMNKERNMPLLTAVNIDGSKTIENNRESDKWILDPRLDKTQQLGGDFYKGNHLDLGHLVRRLDPVWGDEALAANADTFHYTVCAPQHKNLNRVTWLSLEDYILKNTDVEDLKVSVFTGPVFSNQDFPYRDVLLPLEFWKMAAVIKKDGTPSVSAYLLSHKDFLDDMGEKGLISDEGFGEFRTYQISLNRLEELTNLNLDDLKQYDPLEGTKSLTGNDYAEIGGADTITI